MAALHCDRESTYLSQKSNLDHLPPLSKAPVQWGKGEVPQDTRFSCNEAPACSWPGGTRPMIVMLARTSNPKTLNASTSMLQTRRPPARRRAAPAPRWSCWRAPASTAARSGARSARPGSGWLSCRRSCAQRPQDHVTPKCAWQDDHVPVSWGGRGGGGDHTGM